MELDPKSGAGTFDDAFSLPCGANVLTGESAADKIDVLEALTADFFDITIPCDSWPMLCEHALAEWIVLYLPNCFAYSGPLKPEF